MGDLATSGIYRGDQVAGGVTLRKASAADAPACGRILQNWLDRTDWVPDLHDLHETEDFLRDTLIAQGHTTLAVAGGRIAGFLSRDNSFVKALYVAEGFRGVGIGAALLNRAKTETPRLTLWTFVANVAARRFYAREGFVELERTQGDNEEKLPDILLEWRS